VARLQSFVRKFLSPAKHQGVCRDLDPQAPYWISLGGLAGLIFYGINTSQSAPLHQLLHQRGAIQPISLIAGGMVLAFVALKSLLLRTENLMVSRKAADITLNDVEPDSISAALAKTDTMRGVLGRRWKSLLDLWSKTHSSIKITNQLETETEAFDLAQQNSYALPRILVWAIPILGFLGTVIGIGSAVGQFDSFLTNADDIDVLREGLTTVTGGLGTAFDTTFLALSISLIVMLPLAAVERQEQRLLTRIDLLLRKAILPVLPDANGVKGAGVDQQLLKTVVNDAFERHLPNPEFLVEPAKIYAESAAKAIIIHLDPVKTLAEESAAAITEARQSVVDQADALKASLESGAIQINASVQSLKPLLEQLANVQACSAELDHELKQLHSGARLSECLDELKTMLSIVDQTLAKSTKPKRVVLIEQTED